MATGAATVPTAKPSDPRRKPIGRGSFARLSQTVGEGMVVRFGIEAQGWRRGC